MFFIFKSVIAQLCLLIKPRHLRLEFHGIIAPLDLDDYLGFYGAIILSLTFLGE